MGGIALSVCSAGVVVAACPNDALAQTESYGYDALGRLVSVNRSDGTAASYAYDPAGNRSQVVMLTPSVTPADFDLGGPASAASGAWAVSAAPVITGITSPVAVSISGGQYRINGGAWTTATGTISAGQTVQVQVQAPGTGGASQTATLTVGGVSDSFQVTALGDIDPDAATFQDITIHSNEPDVAWVGAESLITGINQPVVLRIQRYGYSGNLDGAWIDYQVFDASNTMVDSGYFDVMGADPNDHRYREVTVQNGYRVKYFAHGATNSGARSATWGVTVWRMTGTPVAWSQKNVSVTVDADNNHNVADTTPDPIVLVDQNHVANEDASYTAGSVFTISGISQPISLQFSRDSLTQTGNAFTRRTIIGHSTNGGASFTEYELGAAVPPVVLTSNNGDQFFIKGYLTTTSGRATARWRNIVTNLTTGQTLGAAWIDMVVDNDDNHNVADYALDPVNWSNLSETSSSTDFVTGGAGLPLTGINRNITLRATITGLSGNLSAGSRLEMWVNGVFRYHSTNLGNGSWAGGDFAPGETVQFVARAVSADGAQRSGSYTVTVQNITTGQTVDTFSVTQAAAAPDYTPDAFSDFTDQNAVTDAPTIWFGPAQTITGINRPITLRVERYNYSGNFNEIYVSVYRDSGAGWVRQGEFDPRNTAGYQYVDFTVNNGDKIHYAVDARTHEGRKTGSMNMVVWNLSQPGGSVQLSSRNVNMTVDNDNNYPIRNVAPIDWDNGAFETNGNTGAGATSYRAITGIEADITIRADIQNITGQGYNLADGGNFYIVSATRGNLASKPWRDGGSLSAVVQPGEQIRFYTDAFTSQGRKQFGFDVQVYNATTGAHLDHHYQSGVLDADNNYNIGGNIAATDWPAVSVWWNSNNGSSPSPNYITGAARTISGLASGQTATLSLSGTVSGDSSALLAINVVKNGVDQGQKLYSPAHSTNVDASYAPITVQNGDQIAFKVIVNGDLAGQFNPSVFQGKEMDVTVHAAPGGIIDTFSASGSYSDTYGNCGRFEICEVY